MIAAGRAASPSPPHAAPPPPPAAPALIAETDAIVQEYVSLFAKSSLVLFTSIGMPNVLSLGQLVYRGFSATLAAFQADAKLDTYGQMSTRRLSQRLVNEVEALSLEGVLEWWHEGIGQVLSRLDEDSASLGRSLRDATLRWFCIEAMKKQRIDLVLSFFKTEWATRVGSTRFRDEWKKYWFALPYTPSPERDRYFAMYFTVEWRDALMLSVENFLNAVFQSLPPPRLVALATTADTMAQLRSELAVLKSQLRTPVVSTPASPIAASSALNPLRYLGKDTPVFSLAAPPASTTLIARRGGLVSRARFAPSLELVAACGEDATAVVYKRPNWSEAGTVFLAASVLALDWFDDTTLALGTSDSSVKVWSLRNQKGASMRTSFLLPRVCEVRFNPSSGGAVLAVSASAARAMTGEVQLWNVLQERLERVLPAESRFLALQFNHNGSLLAAAGGDGVVRVFDAARNEGAIMAWQASQAPLAGLIFNAAETSVTAIDAQGMVKEWSLHKPGEGLRQVNLPWSPAQNRCDAAIGPGNTLAFATAGQRPVVLNSDNSVSVALDALGSAVDWDEHGRLLVGCDDGAVLLTEPFK